MRIWHMLRARLQSMFFRSRRESDLHEELRLHIQHESARLQATGMGPDQARLQALRTFGGVESIEEACRDARGRAWLDGLLGDVRFAWRSFRRTPLVALTIVTTVGLGLGLVTVVFTPLNSLMFRVDEVRNPYELFAVERERAANAEPARFTRALYDAFLRETTAFSDAFAQTPDVDAWVDGRRMEGALVTTNFFDVLGVSATHGRTFLAGDDRPGAAPVMVLSHRAWVRHFSSDPGVLGRTVLVNDTPLHVIGVMPDGFRGLKVGALDFWSPLSLAGQFHLAHDDRGDATDLGLIGRLAPGFTRDQAIAQIQTWDTRRAVERGADRPSVPLILEPRLGTVPQPLEAVALFVPLFFAFGLVLLIGCANVANLLFARAVARQREIGVRLAIGASRRRIVWQLIVESLLLALAAAAVGFAISRAALAVVVSVVTSTFPPDFGDIRLSIPAADWRVALFLVSGAVISTLFFALTPALQATRLDLVRAIRGDVARDARPGRARDALVALQVTGSTLLLVCAAIFLRSSWAAATVDPGIRTADTISIAVLNEERRAAILDIVTREPSVASMSASWPGLLGGHTAIAQPAMGSPDPASTAGKPTVQYRLVSPDYFDVVGVPIVRGRAFRNDERTPSAAVAVVSERVARDLWPAADAVGQVLHLAPEVGAQNDDATPVLSPTAVVVGVARETTGFRLGGVRANAVDVYLPTTAETAGTTLVLRVHGEPEGTRRTLADRMAAIDLNMAEVRTLQTLMRMESYLLAIPFWLTLALGAIALLLTVSGLFSVLSYLVAQRTRDIGVRIALGATRRSVGALVLASSARPVALGLIVGGGLTAALGAVLLASPAAESIGSSVRLFDPVAYTVSLLCIVMACICAALVPALRASRIDPMRALRQE